MLLVRFSRCEGGALSTTQYGCQYWWGPLRVGGWSGTLTLLPLGKRPMIFLHGGRRHIPIMQIKFLSNFKILTVSCGTGRCTGRATSPIVSAILSAGCYSRRPPSKVCQYQPGPGLSFVHIGHSMAPTLLFFGPRILC